MMQEVEREISRRWWAWFVAQPHETQQALIAYWDETEHLPGLEAGHRHADHARRKLLVERSRGMGYQG